MDFRRNLALLGLAALGACASTPPPLSARAAAMPVFAVDQAHPVVAETMGAVRADVCLRPSAEPVIERQAQDDLRRRAEAKGGVALIGYRYRILTANPHAQQCRQILEATAEAVTLGGRPMQASAAHSKPG